jgi:hypothetical protein
MQTSSNLDPKSTSEPPKLGEMRTPPTSAKLRARGRDGCDWDIIRSRMKGMKV